MRLGAKLPVWYWVVAILAILWNAFGCFDFTMTMIRDPGYLAAFPAQYVAYLDTLPLWLAGFWALGVGGGLAASLLLLRRSRVAPTVFAFSLLGLAVTSFYQWTDATAPATGLVDKAISAVIWLVALALLSLSLRMLRRGWLR